MSDLTEYDRNIVEAAERWFDVHGWGHYPKGSAGAAMSGAIQAKRDAQRPRCNYLLSTIESCNKPAIQEVTPSPKGIYTFLRCDEHRIEVREL